jgi:hypothetical protein
MNFTQMESPLPLPSHILQLGPCSGTARRSHLQTTQTTRPLAHPVQKPPGPEIDASKRLLTYLNRKIFTTYLVCLVPPRQIRWSSDEHIYPEVGHVIQSTHIDVLFSPFCVVIFQHPST